MSTLADDLIAAAKGLPKDIPKLKHQFVYVADKIRKAQRFVIQQDARTAIRSLLTSRPSSLMTALAFARLPYPMCWFEWVPPQDAGPIHIGQMKVAKVAPAIALNRGLACLCISLLPIFVVCRFPASSAR